MRSIKMRSMKKMWLVILAAALLTGISTTAAQAYGHGYYGGRGGGYGRYYDNGYGYHHRGGPMMRGDYGRYGRGGGYYDGGRRPGGYGYGGGYYGGHRGGCGWW